MRPVNRIAIASVLGALALAGCGGSDDDEPEATSDPPIGTFVSTADVQEKGPAFSTPVTVMIGKKSVGWQATCNSVSLHKIVITADQLVAQDGLKATTLIACRKAHEQQDKDLTAFFRSNPNWQLDGNRLTLSNDSVDVVLQRDETPPNF